MSGTGQVSIQYEKLKFPVTYFFALGKFFSRIKLLLANHAGSPIAMFLTVRGVTSLAPNYTLPTCVGLLNIFHPVSEL